MKLVEVPRNPLRIASRSLVTAAVVCVIASGLVYGVDKFSDTVALEQRNAQATLSAAELALQNTQTDRARLEENLQLFVRLRQSGFVATPDRLRILETLENAAKNVRQSEINWDMGPQEKRRTLNDDITGGAVAQLVRIPLKLSAKGIHEEEWLALLANLQNAGAGYFAMDSCLYEKDVFAKSQISLPAINVVCNLSWLYVLPEPVAPITP